MNDIPEYLADYLPLPAESYEVMLVPFPMADAELAHALEALQYAAARPLFIDRHKDIIDRLHHEDEVNEGEEYTYETLGQELENLSTAWQEEPVIVYVIRGAGETGRLIAFLERDLPDD